MEGVAEYSGILSKILTEQLQHLFTYKVLKGKISVNIQRIQRFYYKGKREFICLRKRIY